MKRIEKVVSVIFIVTGVVVCVDNFVGGFNSSFPQPASLSAPLLEIAKQESAQRWISVEDLVKIAQTANIMPYVSYSNLGRSINVEYRLYHEGEFYQASRLLKIDWPSRFKVKDFSLEGGRLLVIPKFDEDLKFLLYLVGGLFVGFGCLFLYTDFFFRAKKIYDGRPKPA